MADTINQLTSVGFWLTGIALVILGWLLEPLRPILTRVVNYGADKLVVLTALFLVVIVTFYHVPLYGRPFLDAYLAALYAAFYTALFFGLAGQVRLIVAYIPTVLFGMTFVAFWKSGFETPLEGATQLFPFFVLIGIFFGSPFLLFEAISVRGGK